MYSQGLENSAAGIALKKLFYILGKNKGFKTVVCKAKRIGLNDPQEIPIYSFDHVRLLMLRDSSQT